ncbi:Maph5 [Matsumuraeses phaseoli granulovirus]|uniref:Maph5 n=1 Tax=Matsumuraeses phaseoli granulovirus TaxID=2760664 RepID=A0AAE7SXL7_9BBAC|nr:Maph5 [Matsumuraeses phaseoli granulovirus]QOD39968.1 Maph5 [Matsumuraeses phaseoli granulovirus]
MTSLKNMDNMLDYDEQVEWNKINDLQIYVQNIPNLDEDLKKMIDTLIKGFVAMINKNNKKVVLRNIYNLLQQVKIQNESYDSD